jgi:hypothetical protein
MREMNPDPVKAVWRSQPTEIPAMSISYVRHRASELDRSFRFRNFFEQSTCVLALVGCAVVLVVGPHVWVKVGAALMAAGICYSLFQWRRRVAAPRPQVFESVDAGLVFYRRELERRRDIHRTLWRWYLLPMAPGAAVFLTWSLIGDPHTVGTLTPWLVVGMLVTWTTFAVIYERAKAAQCQREIEALASLDR